MNLIRKLAVVIVALASVSVAQADFIELDLDLGSGDANLTRDNISLLEWLDLDLTEGMTPNDALSAFPGFRFATISEVQELYVNIGLPPPDAGDGIPIEFQDNGPELPPEALPFENLLVLLGMTDNSPSDNCLSGYVQNADELFDISDSCFLAAIQVNETLYYWHYYYSLGSYGLDGAAGLDGGNGPNTNISTFLVRNMQVPEPGTLALLGIGLFGIGFSRRKKKV